MRESFVLGLLSAALVAGLGRLFSENGAGKLAASISSLALLLTFVKPLITVVDRISPLFPESMDMSSAAEHTLDYSIVLQEIEVSCAECLGRNALPVYPVSAEISGGSLSLTVNGADPALHTQIRELLGSEFSASVHFSN